MHFFDIWYGQLDFRMYRQEAHIEITLHFLEYHLDKLCEKNYLDNNSLLNKICELKNILGLKKNKKITSSLWHFCQLQFGFAIGILTIPNFFFPKIIFSLAW